MTHIVTSGNSECVIGDPWCTLYAAKLVHSRRALSLTTVPKSPQEPVSSHSRRALSHYCSQIPLEANFKPSLQPFLSPSPLVSMVEYLNFTGHLRGSFPISVWDWCSLPVYVCFFTSKNGARRRSRALAILLA
jgi:hypothetical protein